MWIVIGERAEALFGGRKILGEQCGGDIAQRGIGAIAILVLCGGHGLEAGFDRLRAFPFQDIDGRMVVADKRWFGSVVAEGYAQQRRVGLEAGHHAIAQLTGQQPLVKGGGGRC